MRKYIFVTGGVISSLGKGITASSLGCILKSRGLKVTIQKLDPYINYNPSTMSPFQHGEVFVTDDGSETDLDLGHYERFIDENLTAMNNYTAGKIYWSVITKERKGEFGGGTVQVIPHITNEIKEKITGVGLVNDVDVVICEIGGTVGDIESLPFLEAIRQMKTDVGRENVFYIHVTMIPFLPATEELKTKPTQHSVKELRSIGIQPDVIVCRSSHTLTEDIKGKIALFCDTEPSDVILNRNVDSIYELPVLLEKEGLDDTVIRKLKLNAGSEKLFAWKETIRRLNSIEDEVTVAMVGRYVSLKDAYISAAEALYHGGLFHNCKVNIRWVEDKDLAVSPQKTAEILKDVHGIVIAGALGEEEQGIEGKINAIRWSRENEVPFFGTSLGMHCAAVDAARNDLNLLKAHEEGFINSGSPSVIVDLSEKKDNGIKYLGSMPCNLIKGTLAESIYQEEAVNERYRQNYAVNFDLLKPFEEKGIIFSGLLKEERLLQIMEIKGHPWFLATLFHPEFRSRPLTPHPLYKSFIRATLDFKN